jgi:1-acyl-sn-glycerol-3-phosphate acyltransferase
MAVSGTLRKAARAGGFVGVTGAMLPAFYLRQKLTKKDDEREVRDRWVSRWSGALLSLFSIRCTIDGDIPPLSTERGRLVVVNHRSAVDIGILLHAFGGKMLSRADIARWPVIGPAAKIVGTIFVDRGSSQSGVVAIRKIEGELKRGETVNMFPEGTTFDGDVVRPFQRGGFVAARAARAEILPVGLAYEKGSGAAFFNETFMSHLGRMSAAAQPTRVVMAIGAPFIATDPSAALARRAEEDVGRLVALARSRLDSGT